MNNKQNFLTGINYWPINKAMFWWKNYEAGEVKADFKKLVQNNFQLVRIFLNWEDFQPEPEVISPIAIGDLIMTADIASDCGLKIMPTFFCGHMSGVNWMPYWMLTAEKGPKRFPVYSNGLLHWIGIRNCYTDPEVISAQLLQIKEVSLALKGNEAIWAYDLGNEASNWVIPPQRSDAQLWLDKMTSQIKNYSGGKMVTLGMHAEDLEEDRRLWPQDAAQHCDFLCMHGYPFYLSWMDDPFDSELVPFLGIITTWLGQKPVLFQEFGVPTRPVLTPTGLEDSEKHIKCLLWSEDEGAIYYNKTLKRLLEERMMGGLAWCFADYSPLIWDKPPLDFNLHERYFGMFRYDGSAKPAVKAFHHYKDSFINTADPCLPNYPWLEKEDRDKFYQGANDLPRLYRKYKEWLKNKQ